MHLIPWRWPFMSEAEERAKTLKSVYYTEYAGTPGASLDDEENWHRANPGLAVGIKSLTGFRAQAEAAMLTPADQNGFRALHLNESP